MFTGSVFLQNFFWCTLAAVLAPMLSTMQAAALVVAAFCSLTLRLVREGSKPLAYAPANKYILLFAGVYLAAAVLSVNPQESLLPGLLTFCFVLLSLVVENGGRLYVADSFCRREYALYDDLFSQVAVGDFTFQRTFTASEVLFFELAAQNAKQVVDGLYASYGELIAYGMRGYQKSRGEKGVLELDTAAAGDVRFKETYEEIRNKGFRKFAEADNAVMPLWKGMKYTSLASKTYSSDTTRDIRAMIDDVTDFTARAYGIPPCLLNGSVQNVESATEQFLTFCVDPLADSLQEEINRKRNGLEGLRRGNFVQFDTGRIKHIDLLDVASSVDKLISSGVECVNDIRALLGQPLINEPWAWKHFMTKNYADIEKVLTAVVEGEQT